MFVTALEPGVGEKQLVSGSPGWFSMVTRRGAVQKHYVNWYPTPPSASQRYASHVPRGESMEADAASPTAGRLTGPSPGADMDGGGTPLSVGGGCEHRSRRGQSGMFVSAGRMERHSIRAGLWLPPLNIFESGRRGNRSPVMLQDDALITQKKSSFDFFWRGGGC